MDLFNDLIAANQPKGTLQGILFGIVAAIDDPLKLQRIQVVDMTKGGQFKSDWLFRALPFTHYSPPLPKLGDLVIVSYIDGNPHKGCYLGLVVNQANTPVGADADLTILLGGAKVTMGASGDIKVEDAQKVTVTAQEITATAPKVTVTASDSLTFTSPQIKLNGTSVQISGKDVVVVGGKDSRGDTITDKGY